MRTIRIGYSGGRIKPAVALAAAKLQDPASGSDPRLFAPTKAVLPLCSEKNIRIDTNLRMSNPAALGDEILADFGAPAVMAANPTPL